MPKLEIALKNNQWTKHQNRALVIDFIGRIYYNNESCSEAKDLASILKEGNFGFSDPEKFLIDDFLPKTDGNFAFIIRNTNMTILVCDFARSYPLFIISDKNKKIITDHIEQISFQKENDELAQEEFLVTGFVSGNRTVYKNVKGIQAGEMATHINKSFSFYRYFTLSTFPQNFNSDVSAVKLYKELDRLLMTSFSRMIKGSPEVNNWIVPLSGGYDSRMIVNYLYKHGCKNVICVTYGIIYSEEVRISKMVAEALNYEWHFVEYDDKDLAELQEHKVFDKYIKYSFNGCSLPHPLDFIAIYKLKKSKIVSENDIVLPGLSAFTETAKSSLQDLSEENDVFKYVYNNYYSLFKKNNNYHRFKHLIRDSFIHSRQPIRNFPEYFYLHEKKAKYFSNWVRVYEFFNLHWRMPLKQRFLLEFWYQLDFDSRINREFLFKACNLYLYHDKLKDVPILNKFQKPQPRKRIIYRILPPNIISLFARIINKKTNVPTGHYLVFSPKVTTIKKIVGPMSLYPKRLRKYFNYILPRRPYQVNVLKIITIYTLRNEVFFHSSNVKEDR